MNTKKNCTSMKTADHNNSYIFPPACLNRDAAATPCCGAIDHSHFYDHIFNQGKCVSLRKDPSDGRRMRSLNGFLRRASTIHACVFFSCVELHICDVCVHPTMHTCHYGGGDGNPNEDGERPRHTSAEPGRGDLCGSGGSRLVCFN